MADGGETWNEAQRELFARFDALGIGHRTVRHAPVFTVDQAQAVRDDVAGAHTKNLFLKDKKGRLFLLVLEETASVDLKRVHQAIGASGRVSFGSAEALLDHLGVTPGSVTAFAIMNDSQRHVTLVIDEPLLEADHICAHPLSNDATTVVSREDFLRFLEACGHPPLVLKLSD
jgi:Ala-tRNA(Pro) deacylase